MNQSKMIVIAPYVVSESEVHLLYVIEHSLSVDLPLMTGRHNSFRASSVHQRCSVMLCYVISVYHVSCVNELFYKL